MKKPMKFLELFCLVFTICLLTGCTNSKEIKLSGGKWECYSYNADDKWLNSSFIFKDNNKGIFINGNIFGEAGAELEFSYIEDDEKITLTYNEEKILMVAYTTLYKKNNVLEPYQEQNKNETYTECKKSG